MRHKPLAVFDIDGTIFRSSLLIELNAKLVAEGIFPQAAQDEVNRVREAWLNRKGSYAIYINTIKQLYESDIKGKCVRDITRVSKAVIAEQKHRVYVFTRDLIRKLRSSHLLIIISFSPIETVREFNRFYEFDIITGTSFLSKRGVYTGEVVPGTVLDKKVILEGLVHQYQLTLRGSIGIGDTETDIGFLTMVERPIAFNPNRKLYLTAKRKGWEIVVERKDVIYYL